MKDLVIPAQAGIQAALLSRQSGILDPRLRGDDE